MGLERLLVRRGEEGLELQRPLPRVVWSQLLRGARRLTLRLARADS